MVSKHTCHPTDPTDCRALVELELGSCGLVEALFNLHATADVRENTLDEGASHMLGRTPPGRRGPEEVAKLALFLASEENSYATVAKSPVDCRRKIR